jgi:hypothetical protein
MGRRARADVAADDVYLLSGPPSTDRVGSRIGNALYVCCFSDKDARASMLSIVVPQGAMTFYLAATVGSQSSPHLRQF